MISREQALDLLKEANTPENLMQHALASEAVMKALARNLNEDETLWGLTGLLHDLDYPATADTPEKHGIETANRLLDFLPESALNAIRAHNAEYTGQAPQTTFDYALRCGETVTGLVSAAALVRPTKMDGMQPKSLRKKMKDKAFAASVSREHIKECSQIGLELDAFLAIAIDAMSEIAGEIGLAA